MASPIRLLLADDHALVREGLKQLFALTTDIQIAAEATNGAQVLDSLSRHPVDLLLLDMTMPGISGTDLILRVMALDSPPPILVLSMHDEPQIARRALAAGALGYITKDNDPELLLAAIRKVAIGGRFIDPALAESMAFETVATVAPTPLYDTLSDREREIFVLLAQGLSVNEIASKLEISNKTVSTHKARLMEKMRFGSNVDIVKFAMGLGLTS
jgi:DNA-binding NarL/FixJ family response regulator